MTVTSCWPPVRSPWPWCQTDEPVTPWPWCCRGRPGLRQAGLCWCPPGRGGRPSRASDRVAIAPRYHSQTDPGLRPEETQQWWERSEVRGAILRYTLVLSLKTHIWKENYHIKLPLLCSSTSLHVSSCNNRGESQWNIEPLKHELTWKH